jgi:predicted transcriptional regulator of viral defense system
MTMDKTLSILDTLAAAGRATFETRDVAALTGQSPQAASNLLSRLADRGLVDRVARGRYAMRTIGSLGTRAVSEDVALAVAAAFPHSRHRIAFGSALDYHGLLEHPVRHVVVAVASPTSLRSISGRPLRTVLEGSHRISVGAVATDHGSFVSSVERALLESAARPALAGGITVVASALVSARPDPASVASLARQLRLRLGLQRVGTLARALGLDELSSHLEPLAYALPDAELDPDMRGQSGSWRDATWRVKWPYKVEELEETVRR